MGRLGLELAVILILIVVRTYPRVCPRRHTMSRLSGLRGKAAGHAADLRARGEAARSKAASCCGEAARGKAASCRGKAARGEAVYNLVKYYLALAFKLFYYVLFDL